MSGTVARPHPPPAGEFRMRGFLRQEGRICHSRRFVKR